MYYAAMVSSAFSIFAYLLIVWKMKLIKKFDLVLSVLFIISLFESYVTFYYVRIPLDNLVTRFISIASAGYILIAFLYAPVTEELAKITPVWISQLFKKTIVKDNQILYAMTIGLAFGIGEMFFLASLSSQNLTLMGYKWYHFYGYMTERFLSCFCHQIFMIVLICWVRKKRIRYFFYAMTLHAITNIPPLLYGNFSFGIYFNDSINLLIVYGYLLSFVLISAAVLIYKYKNIPSNAGS
jgi:hypothetical protein